MESIPYGRQNIEADDLAAVANVLTSEFLTQGPSVAAFEKQFADYIGAKYAVAVSNGTAALHLAAMALNTGAGQKVITTPITFSASANCVRYCGGEVLFADIDPQSYLISIESVKQLFRTHGKNIKGIIPVDFGGRAVNLEQLRAVANEFDCWILEDACHAPGGFFVNSAGQPVKCGNGQYSDLSVFSFHPVKHIACGEGGMITTNDTALYDRLMLLRTHGITRQADKFTGDIRFAQGNTESTTAEWPGWYMEMQELGYNYRLTDIQAALGISQLSKADKGLARRREIAQRYASFFEGRPWCYSHSGYDPGHAYHLYVAGVKDRLGLYKFLRTKNIFPQVHYIPVHLMPYYRKLGWNHGDMPMAEKYYESCLSFPMYPSLTDAQLSYVFEQVELFYSGK